MMFRLFLIAFFLFAPLSVWADVGHDDGGHVDIGLDAGYDDVDSGSVADVVADAEPDVLLDGEDDITADAVLNDVDEEIVDEDAVADTSADTSAVEEGLRFWGQVVLQGRGSFEGVEIALGRPEGEDLRTLTTQRDGQFSFEGLEAGTYEVSLIHPGYVTLVVVFDLQGDRYAGYDLFLEGDVALQVEVVLDGPEANQVELRLTSARNTIGPEGVAVEDGQALWEVATVGVGTWTLRVRAEGYEELSYRFIAREGAQMRLRVFPTESGRQPEIRREGSGCSCGSIDGGGPVDGMVIVFGVALAVLAARRRMSSSARTER